MKELKDLCDSEDSDEKIIDDVTGKYKGKTDSELIGELLSLVKKGRQDGTFSDSQLEEFISLVMPQLDENGQKKLKELAMLIRE